MEREHSHLSRDEQAHIFELRAAWATGRSVVLTLSDRCIMQRLEGEVDRVAITGAFVVVSGWHVPLAEILAIHRPHHSQQADPKEAA